MASKTPPRVPGLVDAHCHLDYAPMSDDLDATLARAKAIGVEQFVHVGCARPAHARALELAAAHPEIFAVVGIHPHEAKTTDDEALRELEAMASATRVVAIGETGLDYYYDHSPREDQRRSFAQHLELATRIGRPIVLHIRDAHDEAMDIVRGTGTRSEAPGMVHCFTGGPDEARRWLDLGFHLSFSGISTFKQAEAIREAVRLCPDDRILLETDAPYLSPEPVRGRKNDPGNVAFTCVRLAAERGIEPVRLASMAAANTRALLALPAPNPTES